MADTNQPRLTLNRPHVSRLNSKLLADQIPRLDPREPLLRSLDRSLVSVAIVPRPGPRIADQISSLDPREPVLSSYLSPLLSSMCSVLSAFAPVSTHPIIGVESASQLASIDSACVAAVSLSCWGAGDRVWSRVAPRTRANSVKNDEKVVY